MQPHEMNSPTGQPQAGYPGPGYSQVGGRLRGNVVASVVAGVLALVTAGLLGCFVVVDLVTPDGVASVVRMNVIGGLASAVFLVIVGVFVLARAVAGAWVLAAGCVFYVIMDIVATPLIRGASLGSQAEFLFGFHRFTGIAAGLIVILCVLNAVVAIIAATAKRP